MSAGSHTSSEDMSVASSVLQKRSLATGEKLYFPGEPIRNYTSPSYKTVGPFPDYKNGESLRDQGDRFKYYSQPKSIGPVRPASLSPNFDAAAASGVSLLGAASLAAPAVLPFAAAAGVGYGAYKLGQSLSLW